MNTCFYPLLLIQKVKLIKKYTNFNEYNSIQGVNFQTCVMQLLGNITITKHFYSSLNINIQNEKDDLEQLRLTRSEEKKKIISPQQAISGLAQQVLHKIWFRNCNGQVSHLKILNRKVYHRLFTQLYLLLHYETIK